ncbi:tRNA epoxyqueuosine(34) reductase QueG [Oleispirillum naphthae]|uniref:tRNA epoxyqueuosine(34) reductase QueG n=1 Tax=Oleispirillum naphthae TaxID=2838853 RepID=UPI00308261CF
MSERAEAVIRAWAAEAGFDVCGITSADAVAGAGPALLAYLAEGRHGEMAWMEGRAAERAALSALWPGAKSAVVCGLNYGPEDDPLALLERRDRGAVSVYARHRDYHDVVKAKLKRVARRIHGEMGAAVKVFVDTAPVMEKPLAERAGLGWIGKHSNLVSRGFGSWLFLGVIATAMELAPDAPHAERCGRCRRCLDACPTAAFTGPWRLDARRCISYLTIEHAGPVPRALRPLIGNRIYGCDDCLAVCPWNRFAQAAAETKLKAREDLRAPPLAELAELDDAAFRARFSGSPVKRIGRARFVRNVLIAIGNSGDAALAAAAEARLSDAEPLVRGAAVWALARLQPWDVFCRRAAHIEEGDAMARAELDAARQEREGRADGG